MTREWIQAITDRTEQDIRNVQYDPTMKNPKGTWNASDLNRIEKNTAYCVEYMLENKIYRSDPKLTIKENDYWTGDMIPNLTEISRVVSNVIQITEYAREKNLAIADALPKLYVPTHVSFEFANDIEIALNILHIQPKLPLDYFRLTLEEGVILRIQREDGTLEDINASEALIAEDEIAYIKGIPAEPDAQYKYFQFWSGDENDLQHLGNWEEEETTYLGQYRDVKFKANFQTRIPRLLKLNSAYISVTGSDKAETGPSNGTYYAGDKIMIIANRAEKGKQFYEWLGEDNVLKNITGAVDEQYPSTAWLAMPDCDVELTPKYINAGAHTVTVTNGRGTGVYEYKDRVSISADVPSHYGFDNWSGDTSYLSDIYSAYQSFEMLDYNLRFTAHYSYRYSYNDIQIINGYISQNGTNVSSVSGARQSSTLQLVPTPPDASQGLDYWEIEGEGSASGTTFYVGDGDAIITGHYAPSHTLTVVNRNNNSSTETYGVVENHSQKLTTNATVGDYKFNGWYENGERLSTNREITIAIADKDRTIEAKYDYYPKYTVTLVNKNNSGQTQTYQVLSGNYWSVSTTEDVGDNLFVRWLKDGNQVSTNYNNYGFYVSKDTTITAEYRLKESYYLTVNNGTGSGYYKERQAVTITADEGDFSDWSDSNLYSISNRYSKTTVVKLGRSDGTVTANYNLRQITVVTHSGSTTYAVRQGGSLNIRANPAPDTYEWDASVGWTIDEGGTGSFSNSLRSDTYFYAGTTDATIRANYKPIPWFTVTVEEGYLDTNNSGKTTGVYLRDSNPIIIMKPAPEGHKFLQWEVLEGNDNNVTEPFAENTTIRNLVNDVKVRATYYIPDPEVKYTLQIKRTDGTITEYHNPVGYQQKNISASRPAEGMKFYRWNGDYQYLTGGRYLGENNTINTPARDILIEETFVPEDWVVKYHLWMKGYGECEYDTTRVDYETNETTTQENWATDYEYEEGSKVRIRTKAIPFGWNFVKWQVVDEAGSEHNNLIDNLTSESTTVDIPDYDIYITAEIVETEKYKMEITDGESNASYYENGKADIYFNKTNTDDIHYEFVRWTGDGIQSLKDYDTGKQFNVLVAGTKNEPQFVKMPARHVSIKATYKTLYKLNLTNATIDKPDEKRGPYYEIGAKVAITADEPLEGQKFARWEGDIDCLQNPFDPTTTVTTRQGSIKITAVYIVNQNQNDIAYTTTELQNGATITEADITLVSGEIINGLIIFDSKGHNYVVTDVNEHTGDIQIARLTKVNKGGNDYE